ncbi:MAG: hypothetical protein HY293_07530 [Planctomycetes bacterium]|nr:hypothetical protein [Planctomycetota bacterium]
MNEPILTEAPDTLGKGNFISLGLIFCAAILFGGVHPPKKATAYYAVASSYHHQVKHESDSAELKLETVFKERLDHYKDFLGKLNLNLFYHLITIVAAILLMTLRKEDFKVPLLDEVVPVQMVYYALPVCFMYLWISFGYLFNDLVATRISLWRMAEVLEPNIEAARKTASWKPFIYTFSLRPLLHDGAYMDGWFMTCVRQCSFNPHESLAVMGVIRVLLVIFGVFMGISNGCMLGVIWHGSRRFGTSGNLKLHRSYFWLCGILLFLTHAAFYWSGNRNWLQVVEITAAFGTLWIIGTLIKAERRMGDAGRRAWFP